MPLRYHGLSLLAGLVMLLFALLLISGLQITGPLISSAGWSQGPLQFLFAKHASFRELIEYCSTNQTHSYRVGSPVHQSLTDSCRLTKPSLGTHTVFGTSPRRCMTYPSRYDLTSHPHNTNELDNELWKPYRQAALSRSAIVFRAWDGFKWASDDIGHLRKMLSELSAVGEEHSVYILLHDRAASIPRPAKAEDIDAFILRHVPREFAHMTELWDYNDCREAYPKVGEYDVYYHAFMALQLFADRHPEYDHYWNWEMDVRYTGRYNDLFPAVAAWSSSQPRTGLWQRNTRFYVPDRTNSSTKTSTTRDAQEIQLPPPTPWIHNLSVPDSPAPEEADLLTFSPMFSTANTNWPHKDYKIHYDAEQEPAGIASVSTNIRLSRHVLQYMSHENKQGRAMMSEMWPSTLAFHHDLKAVYVPHPVVFEPLHAPLMYPSDGGSGVPYASIIDHEDKFLHATWFWNAELPVTLYRFWMGGDPEARAWTVENGPLCLPALLLHPVKTERFGTQG